MNINRPVSAASHLVSFAASLAINAAVLAAFSTHPVHAWALPEVAAPLAGAASEEAAMPEIVVTARRPS